MHKQHEVTIDADSLAWLIRASKARLAEMQAEADTKQGLQERVCSTLERHIEEAEAIMEEHGLRLELYMPGGDWGEGE